MEIEVKDTVIVCLQDGNVIGRIEYEKLSDFILASHIEVNPEHRRSDAKIMLLDELMRMSDESGLKIKATCGYMDHWFRKNHPEYVK